MTHTDPAPILSYEKAEPPPRNNRVAWVLAIVLGIALPIVIHLSRNERLALFLLMLTGVSTTFAANRRRLLFPVIACGVATLTNVGFYSLRSLLAETPMDYAHVVAMSPAYFVASTLIAAGAGMVTLLLTRARFGRWRVQFRDKP
jgi:hypothetical protein